MYKRPNQLSSVIPLPFLGLGVYRAWLEIVFVDSFVGFPTQALIGQGSFDLVIVAMFFLMALLWRRISPLHTRRWAQLLGTAFLLCSTAAGFLSIWQPGLTGVLAWPSALLGGIGIALHALLWRELYACETPVRICLFYALSLVLSALIIYVYQGFVLAWLPAMTCLLPLASLLCLRKAYQQQPAQDRPQTVPASFSFPWKPLAVVALYSLVFGLQAAHSYSLFDSHSSPGMLLCAVLVALVLIPAGGRRHLPFEALFGMWLPYVAALCLLLPSVLPAAGSAVREISAAILHFGYTASEIFVMVMVGSLCYHYHVSAVWLFGIERGARALLILAGRLAAGWADGLGAPVEPVIVLAVMLATFLVLSNQRLDASWGVSITAERLQDGAAASGLDAAHQRAALVQRCSQLAKTHKLSQREEEVLILLAEHKTAGDIERSLLIAHGTVKAHIGHVYQKLGIHSRSELFEITAAAEPGEHA